MKKIALILCLFALAVNARFACPGCVVHLSAINLKKAENILNFSLNKLDAGSGPHYKLIKVNGATVQVIAGIKYVINAELIDTNNKMKTCSIIIWSQPWITNGTEVTFDCPGEEKIIRRHCSLV